MEPRAVVKRLKEFGRNRRPLSEQLDGETRTLIQGDPFAFLIAAAFRRDPWEKAYRIPAEIKLKGCLDPVQLASKSEPELVGLLEELTVSPRWGVEQGAKTLSDAASLVCERFGGDAGAIWRDAPPGEVAKTLQEIHGIGPRLASIATRILHDDWGCFSGHERQIDVKPTGHLVRVFRRLGIITKSDSEDKAILAARHLNREFPGELDWPAWRIGNQWCHPGKPKCAQCPLTEDCAKRL